MKTLVYSAHEYDRPFLVKVADTKHILHFTEEPLTELTAAKCKGYEAIALFSNDDASAKVLEKLSENGINYIALRSVGYDHVDLAAAKKHQIKVANVPEYSPYAIAEHGVAMLMMLNRKLFEAQLLIQMQDFRLDPLVGFDLNGKTVGVIGTGKIGFAFAKIMNGFGCTVLASDPLENPNASSINMKYTSLEELLKKSDVVSLNCPLNPQTRYLIDESQLAMMKKGAILINTARGAVVNTKALISSLESGHLGGACLDVYEKEKGLYFFDHRNTTLQDEMFTRLRSFKNILITGHQAFLTREALQGIADTTIANLDAWEAGTTSPNEIN